VSAGRSNARKMKREEEAEKEFTSCQMAPCKECRRRAAEPTAPQLPASLRTRTKLRYSAARINKTLKSQQQWPLAEEEEAD